MSFNKNPLFSETAEEMVNRLFDEWVADNSFANSTPLLSTEYRQGVIDRLKKVDQVIINDWSADYTGWTDNEIYLDKKLDEAAIREQREHFVLFDLATTFSYLFNKTLISSSPPPTNKHPHLRLVVNG